MKKEESIEYNAQSCSKFIRKIVQNKNTIAKKSTLFSEQIPKIIVQFWDNFEKLPDDVNECIETWVKAEEQGFERLLFDKDQARVYIDQKLGTKYTRAFDKCYHPAMQSDYFRLCYIFEEGGCYIDVDDRYHGTQFQKLFNDSRLKIQPLCYDISTNLMVSPSIFTKLGANDENWIFYFNNNPLIAGSGHPIIKYALSQATYYLEKDFKEDLPEIQSTTGPGNLTKSIFDVAKENTKIEDALLVLCNWEDIATSKWELSYRNDSRNWRLSNCKAFNNNIDENN